MEGVNPGLLFGEGGHRRPYEDSWRDSYWGWGRDRTGKNRLGALWEGIRHDLNAGLLPAAEPRKATPWADVNATTSWNVDQFAAAQHEGVTAFVASWKSAVARGEPYPQEMSPGDWDEQFQAFTSIPPPLFLKDVDPHPDRAGDRFRPSHDPARFLYDTLCDEMARRKTPERLGMKWVDAERRAMFEAAAKACAHLGRIPVDMDVVMTCEFQSLGHTDYATKWACALADVIRRQPKSKQS